MTRSKIKIGGGGVGLNKWTEVQHIKFLQKKQEKKKIPESKHPTKNTQQFVRIQTDFVCLQIP
jgi:hypothetical protein